MLVKDVLWVDFATEEDFLDFLDDVLSVDGRKLAYKLIEVDAAGAIEVKFAENGLTFI